MLKAMDAILFGPPVYDNTVKDFVLFLAILIAIVASVTVMQLKRQNSKIEVGFPQKSQSLPFRHNFRWSTIESNSLTRAGVT